MSKLKREFKSKTGYYGKMPIRGDFITKGVPAGFTDPWHIWVTEVLAQSRMLLGEAWIHCYLTAPLYRFALSPGICGPYNWIGVMIPSVDRVGRYYPMTLCKCFPADANPFVLMDRHDEWFEKAGSLLLSCLDETFNLQEFDEQIDDIDKTTEDDATITMKKITISQFEDSAWQIPHHPDLAMPVVYPELMKKVLGEFYSSFSIWRTFGSDLIEPCLFVSEGLPPASGAAALLDGNWEKWGWINEYDPPQ